MQLKERKEGPGIMAELIRRGDSLGENDYSERAGYADEHIKEILEYAETNPEILLVEVNGETLAEHYAEYSKPEVKSELLTVISRPKTKEDRHLLLQIARHIIGGDYPFPSLVAYALLNAERLEKEPVYELPLEALTKWQGLKDEEIDKIRQSIEKSEGVVRKALPFRGLASSDARHLLRRVLEKESISTLPEAMELVPAAIGLINNGLINKQELDNAYRKAKSFKQALTALLEEKGEKILKQLGFETNNAKKENIKALIENPQALLDLAIYAGKYSGYAATYMHQIFESYLEGGVEGFKKFKFYGHELAKEQLQEEIAERLETLDSIKVDYAKRAEIPFDKIGKDIETFARKKAALYRIAKQYKGLVEEKIEEAINELKGLGNANADKIVEALRRKDFATIKTELSSKTLSEETRRAGNKAASLIRLYDALSSIEAMEKFAEKFQKMKDKTGTELEKFVEGNAERLKDYVDYLMKIAKGIERDKGKITGSGEGDIEEGKAAAQALASAFELLEPANNKPERIFAQITFDPVELIEFGRYGSSGVGNCQISTGNSWENQGMMSIIGDANELMIAFKDEQENVIGFLQVHVLYSKEEKNYILLFEHKAYTNMPNKADEIIEAARRLAYLVEKETGLRAYMPSDGGELRTLVAPRTIVNRYLDFLNKWGPGKVMAKVAVEPIVREEMGLKRS
ncbi:MAG: hypothetical protein ACP5GD_03770 [Candidatus Micrarchaeia archaeon]